MLYTQFIYRVSEILRINIRVHSNSGRISGVRVLFLSLTGIHPHPTTFLKQAQNVSAIKKKAAKLSQCFIALQKLPF
jgi:vacuolar-type H+-ATPase subunit D/Vma8